MGETDITRVAVPDMSADTNVYKFVTTSTNGVHFAGSAGMPMLGITQTNAVSSEPIMIRTMGTSRIWAGAALKPGERLTNNASAWAVVATSGDYVMGENKTNVVSGSLGEMQITHGGYENA